MNKILFSSESKIKELDEIDFTKEAILPTLPKWVMDKHNLKDKPIKLKTEIITRNTERHKDITTNDLKIILGISLYNPVIILQNDKSKNLCFLEKN